MSASAHPEGESHSDLGQVPVLNDPTAGSMSKPFYPATLRNTLVSVFKVRRCKLIPALKAPGWFIASWFQRFKVNHDKTGFNSHSRHYVKGTYLGFNRTSSEGGETDISGKPGN